MATQKMAQAIIYCDLCKTTPAQMHCNLCIANLCKPCVGEHISNDPSKDHNVVIFKMRNIKPIFPNCASHKKQTCEMHCQRCNTPVCNECIASGSHKQHDLIELLEICNSKKEKLSVKARKLEKIIYPSYENNISELETQIEICLERNEKLMTDISKQGEEWHKEVDIIINKCKAEAEETLKQNLDILNKNMMEMKTTLPLIRQAILDIKELLKLNNFREILAFKSSNYKFEYPFPNPTIKHIQFVSLPIQVEQLLKMFGTMTEISEPNSPSPVKLLKVASSSVTKKTQKSSTLTTPYIVKRIDECSCSSNLEDIACLSENAFWVMGNDGKIKRINFDGLLQETFTLSGALPRWPNGITVTRQDDLIYTDLHGIHKVKDGKDLKIISVGEWIPAKISCTASGDLLVCMVNVDANIKVVRYSGATEKQVIQYNDAGEPLFTSSKIFIDENGNGDICVSNTGAKKLVVLNKTGKLRFCYSGNRSSQKYKSFDPRGIVTDSLCQILTADHENNCIHIIDCDGNFICYIDNCELSKPYDLSVDKNNTLYVAEFDTKKVKIIKYLSFNAVK